MDTAASQFSIIGLTFYKVIQFYGSSLILYRKHIVLDSQKVVNLVTPDMRRSYLFLDMGEITPETKKLSLEDAIEFISALGPENCKKPLK